MTQPVQYGEQVQGFISYFSQYPLLPYARLQEVFADVFGVKLSQGTIENTLKRSVRGLGDFEVAAKAALVDSGVVHFDETGMRVKPGLHWLHVACTEEWAYDWLDANRGQEAMERMGVLPEFSGCAVHDHWKSYDRYDCEHALCNAHHLRELIHAQEQYQQGWAGHLKKCLLDAKEEVDKAKERGTDILSEDRVRYWEGRYRRVLKQGEKE